MCSPASNLPDWPGAAGAYSRSYRIMSNMARSGAVTLVWRGRRVVGSVPSPELSDFAAALDRGVEEEVKGLNLAFARFDY